MNSLRSCARCAFMIQRVLTVNHTGKRCIARFVAPTIRELVRRRKKLGPQPIPERSNFLEWNYEAELYSFNARLSEEFNPDNLSQAFTFRSYLVQEEQKQRDVGITDPNLDLQDNIELIKNGQMMTETIVKVYLCRALPQAPEECIYAILDYLMSQEVVAKASFHIGTKDLILSMEYPPSEDTLACTFFALVAALAQSPGVDSVRTAHFVRDFLIACLSEKELTEIWRPNNPEKTLNEVLVRDNREIAEPRLIGQAGVESLLAVYHVAFYSRKIFLGKGFGETIEEARETAAIAALNRMFGISDSCKPIRYDMEIDVTSDTRMENLPLTQWCTENVNEVIRQ